MSYQVINGDITEIEADIIVNASNGIGYMGGLLGKYKKLKGVAEAIHYKTHGVVEKEAKRICRKSWIIPRRITGGIEEGEIFVTGAGNLSAKHIIHAVTMRFPGSDTNLCVIQDLIPKVYNKAIELGAKTLVIPLLGTGTGGLEREQVLEYYNQYFANITDLDIKIINFKE